MSEAQLAVLNYALLALLYAFFGRVMWAVWSEVKGPRVGAEPHRRGVQPGEQPERPASRGGGNRGGRARTIPTRLVVLEPRVRKGSAYPIAGDVIIGRSTTASIQLPDDTFASSMHTRVWVEAGDVWVEDLGSTNGTTVNGQKLHAAMLLHVGDRVRVGDTLFEASR
ncbi:MAG: FHA domain-containing protein [Ilumatobacteraceae bacterium]